MVGWDPAGRPIARFRVVRVAAFLLDANVLSEPLRPKPHPGVMRRIQENLGQIAVPAPAWHELLFGCQRLPPSRRRDVIELYLEEGIRSVFPILAYDEAAASWHAKERARLVGIGRTPQFVDGQIASIAANHGLALVTINTSDFNGFEGLVVENWAV